MSESSLPKQILIKIKATHFNFINKNSLLYTENAVKRGAKSWTAPYNKPQLVAHSIDGDPIGRIIDYSVIKGKPSRSEPTDYVEITARINDADAIEKILDGRYSTVSVGSTSCRVICSECDQIITEDGLCEHKKGSYNEDGKQIYWLIDQIGYTENSFVNEPADEYAIIDQVHVGGEWVNFTKFSDNRESYLNVLKLEDNMDNTDTKLSMEQRANLPDTSFCGPNKSFPAHDKAHVTAGLNLLGRVQFSDSTKDKIRADLYRKGKRFGIVPKENDVGKDFDILHRLEDEFIPEEITELNVWFKDNPDSDLPETIIDNKDNIIKENTSSEDKKSISKMKRDALVEKVTSLQLTIEDAATESKSAIDARDSKINVLEGKVQKAKTVVYELEDTLNKYVDKICVLEQKYQDSIISNIMDLKLTDNTTEENKELRDKMSNRTLESLEDSLNDLRCERSSETVNTESRVVNPTQTIDNKDKSSSSDKILDPEENGDPRFKIFSVDRHNVEAE